MQKNNKHENPSVNLQRAEFPLSLVNLHSMSSESTAASSSVYINTSFPFSWQKSSILMLTWKQADLMPK